MSTATYDPVVEKLSADARNAARTMGEREAQFLVRWYYDAQEDRIRNDGRLRSLTDQPNAAIDWLAGQATRLERRVHELLDEYSGANELGQWMRGIIGIGPVMSAGFLAHVDWTRHPTVGHVWRFAGLDPGQRWLGKVKATAMVKDALAGSKEVENDHIVMMAKVIGRTPESLAKLTLRLGDGEASVSAFTKASSQPPWNQDLKVLCWKLGESFIKVYKNPKSLYGRVLAEDLDKYRVANERGDYAAAAEKALVDKNYGKSTEAFKAYSKGKLPPAHVLARAKRHVVKLFISHAHYQAHVFKNGKPPPMPWVIAHGGHTDFIPPPGREKGGGEEE